MQQYFESVKYRITEGTSYDWKCYGSNSYQLNTWNGVHGAGGWSSNVVFSTKNQKVYEASVYDYTHDRAYRLINPKYRKRHDTEAATHGVRSNQAWDDVDYINLDVAADFLEKLMAISDGKEYDTRVQIQVDFSDEELLRYMTLAHEQDITLNQWIEQALQTAIQQRKLPAQNH